MAGDAEISKPAALPRVIGRPFARGVSGNPGGRSKTQIDIAALARAHGPAAIQALAQALRSRSERVRIAAAALLLDRGYGRAPMTISGTDSASLTIMHLTATIEADQQVLEELAQRQSNPVIDGQSSAVVEAPATLGDLSTPASE